METNALVTRKLFGREIRQRTDTEFLCVNDLLAVGNQWRSNNGMPTFTYSQWENSISTKEFLLAAEAKYGKIKITSFGRNGKTWVHPVVFMDIALSISPECKVEVFEWLYDNLVKLRTDSGDSFKKMSGALYTIASDKNRFQKNMVKLCLRIKEECGVKDWGLATKDQIALRDKIHNNIALLCNVLKKSADAIDLGIAESKGLLNKTI